MRFKVKVNDSIELDITEDMLSQIDAVSISDSKFHVLKENKAFTSEITDANFHEKSYKVKVNKNTYNIIIYNDLDALIKKMGFASANTKQVDKIKAPMPGLILDIQIKVGQEMKENDALLILEAMKMENIITSPRDGVIKSVLVNKGDAVDKNQLLVELE